MKRVIVVQILILAAVGFTFSQSGRKAAATRTPPPRQVDATEYSESKSQPRRTQRITERFPNVGGTADPKSSPAPVLSPAPTLPDAEGDVVRVETNLVTIPVSVFDRNGLYIPGLRQNEFKIYEDGVEQEIAYFGTTEKPFTVALVLDVSPSTAYKIDEIRRAATAFVDQLQPQDSVIVIEFDHSVNVLTQATQDRAKIYKAISKADFGDGTSLYNAVDEALRKQLDRIQGRKAVVLFTDGVDTTSRKNSYEGTLDFAEESDSLIFPIYYNTYFDNNRRISSPFPDIFGGIISNRGGSAEDYALGRRYLEELA
ncbi:MAG: VWA domain-containing protein, partial [Pyrinomonadaceae bacterium]